MSGGGLPEHLVSHPGVDRLSLVCVPAVVFDPMLTPVTSCLMSPMAFFISTLAT